VTDEHVVIPVTDSAIHQWVRSFETVACYLMLDFVVERLLELNEPRDEITDFVQVLLNRDIPF